jgi:hypothetical protein
MNEIVPILLRHKDIKPQIPNADLNTPLHYFGLKINSFINTTPDLILSLPL